MAIEYNQDRVMKDIGIKTSENSQEFFELGADAKNVFIQDAEHTQYGDADGVVDLQTKLDNFNRSVRNIGSGVAAGEYAAAFGQSTQANGQSSHAEGHSTIASGIESHAEGVQTEAHGEASHAEGIGTKALRDASHAEGCYTIAYAPSSHAEGENSHAEGVASHAEGRDTIATGHYSHAEGWQTNSQGLASHTEGYSTVAQGDYSHAEGRDNIAGKNSHVEGGYHLTSYFQEQYVLSSMNESVTVMFGFLQGNSFNLQGYKTKSPSLVIDNQVYDTYAYGKLDLIDAYSGSYLTLEPGYYQGQIAKGNILYDVIYHKLHAQNSDGDFEIYSYEMSGGDLYELTVTELRLFKKEFQNISIYNNFDEFSHIQGKYSMPVSNCAHIVGGGTSDTNRKNIHTIDWNGNAEFAGDVIAYGCKGENPISLKALSTKKSIGLKTEDGGEIFNDYANNFAALEAHAEGHLNRAEGGCSHAEGQETQAIGKYSHAEGYQTLAKGQASHVEGMHNTDSYYSLTEIDTFLLNVSDAWAPIYGVSANWQQATQPFLGRSFKYVCRLGEDSVGMAESLRDFFNLASVIYALGYDSNQNPIGLYDTYSIGGSGFYFDNTISFPIYITHLNLSPRLMDGRYVGADQLLDYTLQDGAHVQGAYNIIDSDEYAHVIGNGTSDKVRSNAHTIDWHGNAMFAGDIRFKYDKTVQSLTDIIKNLQSQIDELKK